MAASDPDLEALDTDLWVARRPFKLIFGNLGTRMTVVRLASGELWVHCPVSLDEATRSAVEALGSVGWIFGPNNVHHLSLPEWAAAYPQARLCGAPGLPDKQPDLAFHHLIAPGGAPPWGGEIQIHVFRGAPRLDEVVCFHVPTRTLVLTDLAFHVDPAVRNDAPFFHWLVGATGRFGPHRLVRSMIRDHAAARRSVEAILAWDFDRVVVSHGEVLETGGRRAFEDAFRYLSA